jgi:hypothetical protein
MWLFMIALYKNLVPKYTENAAYELIFIKHLEQCWAGSKHTRSLLNYINSLRLLEY